MERNQVGARYVARQQQDEQGRAKLPFEERIENLRDMCWGIDPDAISNIQWTGNVLTGTMEDGTRFTVGF